MQVKFDSYLANPDSLILAQASQLHSTKVRYVEHTVAIECKCCWWHSHVVGHWLVLEMGITFNQDYFVVEWVNE